MRFASGRLRRSAIVFAVVFLPASVSPRTQPLVPLSQQRYSMGTMFDIAVYHTSRQEAAEAIAKAMDEISRLDQVMSHHKADSDLSKLVREGRTGFAIVEPTLYEVIQESLVFSRRSSGVFDVTIAPLVKTWRDARAQGRIPSAEELAAAKDCVGYDKIETAPPDRLRFRSQCLDIDLGGIGKGYAVDRAIGVLKAAGIRHALINAGSSSIASIGHPPGRSGWPVSLGAGGKTLLLHDSSVSTSRQSPAGEIVDPRTGSPSASQLEISVVAPSATVSDALSTTLLLLSMDDGRDLLLRFPGVAAVWISGREVKAWYRERQLDFDDAR